jgi:hypothetical protein
MNCPHCGKVSIYVGATRVECATPGCPNSTFAERAQRVKWDDEELRQRLVQKINTTGNPQELGGEDPADAPPSAMLLKCPADELPEEDPSILRGETEKLHWWVDRNGDFHFSEKTYGDRYGE